MSSPNNKATAAHAPAAQTTTTSSMSRPPKKPSSSSSSSKTEATTVNQQKKPPQPPKPPPPIPPPVPLMGGAHNKKSSSNASNHSNHSNMDRSDASRLSLRESLNQRKMSLTRSEHEFLEALIIHGNEIEVSLAVEKLNDENLFFSDHHHNHNSASTRHASISTTTTGTPPTGPTTPRGMDNSIMSDMSSTLDRLVAADAARAANDILNSGNQTAAPLIVNTVPLSSSSVGSARRQELLQIRRNSLLFGKMWQAHETGLSVSHHGASRRSVMVQKGRSNSMGSIMSMSSMNNMNGGSFGRDVFRRRSSSINSSKARSISFNGRVEDTSFRTSTPTTGVASMKMPPGTTRVVRRCSFQNSTTTTGLMNDARSDNLRRTQQPIKFPPPLKGDERGRQRSMQRRKSDSLAVSPSSTGMAILPSSKNSSTPLQPPLLPPLQLQQLPPSSLRRLMSDGSGRKSVTFGDLPSMVAARQLHTLVDESDDGDASSSNSAGKDEPLAASSSASTSLKQDDDEQQQQQQEPPLVARRCDSPSQSSIPSLHLAHPLRSYSILSNSSIPSLHHAHSIRSNSIDSRPSIHLAHPIRSNSMDSRSAVGGQVSGSAAAAAAAAAAFSFDGSFDDRDPSETAGSRFEEKKTESSSDDVMLNTWLNGNNNNNNNSSSSSPIPTRVVVPQDNGITDTRNATDQQQRQQQQKPPIQPLHDNQRVVQERALLIREASVNAYRGEGMEIAELDNEYHLPHASVATSESSQPQPQQPSRPAQSSLQAFIQNPLSGNVNIVDIGNHMGFLQQSRPELGSESLLSSFGGAEESYSRSIHLTNSFDETMSVDCSSRRRRNAEIFRQSIQTISRSLSDDDVTGVFLGGSRYYNVYETSTAKECRIRDNDDDDDASWRTGDDEDLDYYDPWLVIEDEYENGYGGGDTLPFRILGTSGNDHDARPHVMSPPLMESLQAFLPYSKAGENFWMKFSMVRDGATMSSLLRHARGSKYTFLAIETTDGEVFGSFTSAPWRKNWNYFGGEESFLWRMRHTRKEKSHSIIDQAKIESEIDVYHCTGENYNIQLCTHDRIAVGGGVGDSDGFPSKVTVPSHVQQHQWGFGLTIEEDLLQGTSSPCLTFGSPSLSNEHADGSRFEIINLELWTLTPCQTLQDAEKLELGLLFLDSQKTSSGNMAYDYPGSKDDDDDDDDYELSASPLSPSGFSAASNLAVTSPSSEFSRR